MKLSLNLYLLCKIDQATSGTRHRSKGDYGFLIRIDLFRFHAVNDMA